MLRWELGGESVCLLPERGLWWEKEKTLILADLHWGKSGHFRKNGIAIPVKSQTDDEMRLAQLIRETGAERMIVAGDLFHSKHNQQVTSFSHFRRHHQELCIELVMGNHDVLPSKDYATFNILVHQERFCIQPFCIAHEAINHNSLVISGHIHPALRIKAKGNNQAAVKLPCFAQNEKGMILPAFGRFTGNFLLNEADYTHLFLIADEKVLQWK